MGAVSFWWIAGQGYVFVLVALAEIWLDPLFRKKLLRPILSLGVMAGCIWFTLAVVFVAAPLRINAVCHSSHYPSGTELDGIKWQPYFSDLRFIVSNDSDADYEDLDIELKPDMAVADIKQEDDTPNVSFVPIGTKVAGRVAYYGRPGDSTLYPFSSPSVFTFLAIEYDARSSHLCRLWRSSLQLST